MALHRELAGRGPGTMAGVKPLLTRERLASLRRRRLHGGRNVTKATVDLVETEGHTLVLKDFASRPWPVRRLLGPWQLDREERAYAVLAGARGTAAFVARVDRQAIALQYVPGRSLAACRPGDLQAGFFDRLERLLDEIHTRGVAHGDLHRHDVLVGGGEEPFLVDFSTSVVAPAGAGAVSRFLFRQMSRADRRSAAKLRRRFLPGSDAPVPERSGMYRVGGWGRRLLDRLRRAGGS
ncbi:MAG TPA: phosphotransferase, partial [Candidatus Polarisedimenticolia bacterium]|nr:phosphotransferase [Candidatus Polarisedimenticolia bacterium]